jgi:hypothetical protein
MPLITPVTQVVDTTNLPPEFRTDEYGRDVPRRTHQPFRDPETLTLHPYVRDRYITAQLKAVSLADPVVQTGPGLSTLRTFPPILPNAEHFKSGGAFAWRYTRPQDVLRHSAERVVGHLVDLRDPTLEEPKSVYPVEVLRQLEAIRWAKVLMSAQTAVKDKTVDFVAVFATIYCSGAALLTALHFYRKLEERRHALRDLIRREKQSFRAHLRYWRGRVRPDTFVLLEREAQEILVSLNSIRHPDDHAVKAYRRLLGIYRGGTHPGRHHFWTCLIGWAVRQIKKSGCTEKAACEIVAHLLHAMWPRIHPNNPSVVKSRAYRTS